jgi:hypothetical protein
MVMSTEISWDSFLYDDGLYYFFFSELGADVDEGINGFIDKE